MSNVTEVFNDWYSKLPVSQKQELLEHIFNTFRITEGFNGGPFPRVEKGINAGPYPSTSVCPTCKRSY